MGGRPASRITLLSLAAAGVLVLARCGAEGIEAPPEPEVPVSQCRTLEESMPKFFELLRDPVSPLKGLREVIAALSKDQASTVARNPIAGVMGSTIRGLENYTKDPPETDEVQCISLAEIEANPPANKPLCSIEAEPGEACENRMCIMRRALSLGLRDAQAKAAVDELRPMLAKFLGYVSNQGAGADGKEHYEAFNFLHRSALNPGLCAPENLVDVIDGLVVYLRNAPNCGDQCVGIKAITAIEALVNDPALQELLVKFESSQSTGQGRAAFQTLGRIFVQALVDMPEDEHYFDAAEDIVELLYIFMDSDPEKYGAVRERVEEVLALGRGLLDPNREGAILKPMKAVARCLVELDKPDPSRPDVEGGLETLVGAGYDLLSRSEASGEGLDLRELVRAVKGVVEIDRFGLLAGAIHSVLASLRQDEDGLEALRIFLVEVQTVENARLMMPALQKMIEVGALDELFDMMDEMLYGCRQRP